jgi:hypothetical protein
MSELRLEKNNDDAKLKAPIFILGSHKSGSSLLRSLLDGHPNLFPLPKESHFFQYGGYWVDYRLRSAQPRQLSREDLIQNLTELVSEYNVAMDPYADSVTVGKFDLERFRRTLEAGGFENPRARFETYVEALYASLTGHALDETIRIVEKSVENAEWAPALRHMFPDCRFIHIVRNPYASLLAIRKAKSKRGFPFLRNPILALKNSYYNLYRNTHILGDYLLIRYEDLVSSPEKVMRQAAKFLGIEFQEILLKPTVLGEIWGGNSTSGQNFDSVAKAPLENWKNQITSLEIALVNKCMGHVLSRFGYETLEQKSSLAWPNKSESPKVYVRNRMLLSYV